MKTAVIYWSGTGNTEAMAHAVAEGMTAAGVEAVLLTPAEVQPGDLNTYDASAASVGIRFGFRISFPIILHPRRSRRVPIRGGL